MWLQAGELEWGLSVNMWSDVKRSDVEWTGVIYVKWFCFEVKWNELRWSSLGQSTCMTYTSAKCTATELLMMGKGTARNM
jgi:hypothetical protein